MANGVPVNFQATTQRIPAMYYITQEKWTGTVTPKLILEAGFSFDKLLCRRIASDKIWDPG